MGLQWRPVGHVTNTYQLSTLIPSGIMYSDRDSDTRSTCSQDPIMLEMLHGGRPRNEEPHVKKRMGKHGEKVDLILRVDLEELGITDDEFDEIQSLFQLYDHDKDGILNFKETQKVLRCLGLRINEDQVQ